MVRCTQYETDVALFMMQTTFIKLGFSATTVRIYTFVWCRVSVVVAALMTIVSSPCVGGASFPKSPPILEVPDETLQQAGRAATQNDPNNPFLKKVFITARKTDQPTGYANWSDTRVMGDIFRFFAFNTSDGVTVGECVFRIYLDNSARYPVNAFPVTAVRSQDELYKVDPKQKTVTIGKESYTYEVKGKVVTLKTLLASFDIYEVPQPFFLKDSGSVFLSYDVTEPAENTDLRSLQAYIVANLRHYVDSVIARTQAAPPPKQ
jgi:hypothetical protein